MASDRSDIKAGKTVDVSATPPLSSGMGEILTLRSDLLASIRAGIVTMIKMKLRTALTEDFI